MYFGIGALCWTSDTYSGYASSQVQYGNWEVVERKAKNVCSHSSRSKNGLGMADRNCIAMLKVSLVAGLLTVPTVILRSLHSAMILCFMVGAVMLIVSAPVSLLCAVIARRVSLKVRIASGLLPLGLLFWVAGWRHLFRIAN